jgi:hypothetical protein
MSDLPTVTPTPPAPATVEEVTPPSQEGRTFWAAAAGIASAIAGGLTAPAGVLTAEPWKTRLLVGGGLLLIVSQVLGNISSVFAKTGGVHAAAKALEITRAEKEQDLFPPGTIPPGRPLS